MNYETYFRELLERESEAAKVPFRAVRHHEREPKKNDCHNNVDYWVRHHAEIKAVRGWLFWGPDAAGQYIIMAHSVLDEIGQIVDITPIDESTPREGLRFLRHHGTEAEFAAIEISCSHVFFPPIGFQDWREC